MLSAAIAIAAAAVTAIAATAATAATATAAVATAGALRTAAVVAMHKPGAVAEHNATSELAQPPPGTGAGGARAATGTRNNRTGVSAAVQEPVR